MVSTFGPEVGAFLGAMVGSNLARLGAAAASAARNNTVRIAVDDGAPPATAAVFDHGGGGDGVLHPRIRFSRRSEVIPDCPGQRSPRHDALSSRAASVKVAPFRRGMDAREGSHRPIRRLRRTDGGLGPRFFKVGHPRAAAVRNCVHGIAEPKLVWYRTARPARAVNECFVVRCVLSVRQYFLEWDGGMIRLAARPRHRPPT